MKPFIALFTLATFVVGCGGHQVSKDDAPRPKQVPKEASKTANDVQPAAKTTRKRRATTSLRVIGIDSTLNASGTGLDSFTPDPKDPLVGFCPKGAINGPMRARVSEFRGCYERALKEQPRLEGRVDVHFSVGKDGRAMNVSTKGLKDVGACIAKVVQSIEFPWRQGCHDIKWPFIFNLD